jgi:hypothetical protein
MTIESKSKDRGDMLVSGIANIERARKQIEEAVTLLMKSNLRIHLDRKALHSTKGESVKFRPDSSSKWTFQSSFGSGGRTKWYIYFERTCVVDQGELHPFGALHVMGVRKNLGDLIDDLISEVPDLGKLLALFFEAADA